MKKNFYIDSIECHEARIVEEKTQKSYTLPLSFLPKGAREDQWFSLETHLLPQKGEELEQEIEDLFAQLEKGQENQGL